MKENPAAVAFLKANDFKVASKQPYNPEIYFLNHLFTVSGYLNQSGMESCYVHFCEGYCLDGNDLCKYERRFYLDEEETDELGKLYELAEKLNAMFEYPTIGGKRNVLIEKYITNKETI